jgi:hypothetical protein
MIGAGPPQGESLDFDQPTKSLNKAFAHENGL